MSDDLFERCEEFVQYHGIIKEALGLSGSSEEFPVGAYYFMTAGVYPDIDRIRICRELLRKRTGVFSSFRSYCEDIMACMLACEEDPEYRLELSILAHRYLRMHLPDTAYLPVLAYFISESIPETEYERYARKTNEIFGAMNDDHRLLTGAEDVLFAGLFALSGRRYPSLLSESEEIFAFLRPEFSFNGNVLQTLSHALTLCTGEWRVKASRLLGMYRKLTSDRIRFPKSFQIVTLGILVNSGIDIDTIHEDFLYAESCMQELLPSILIGKQDRYAYAVLVLAAYYMINSTEFTAAAILKMIVILITSSS